MILCTFLMFNEHPLIHERFSSAFMQKTCLEASLVYRRFSALFIHKHETHQRLSMRTWLRYYTACLEEVQF